MVTIEQVGAKLYIVGLPFSAKDDAKSTLGMSGKNFDADRKCWWVGVAKRVALEAFVKRVNEPVDPNAPKVREDPHNIRLTGKGRYKDREYYAGAITQDRQRVRLLTLPDADGKYLDFWAPCAEVTQTKTYSPREVWDGRRGNGTRTVYTTLGSIADFIADERAKESAGTPQCASCHKRSNDLIEDLEDGLMKCRKCCDMPSE